MEGLEDFWALIWPILEEIFNLLSIQEKVLIFLGYIVVLWILFKISSGLISYDRKNIIKIVLNYLFNIFLPFVGIIILGLYLKSQYPLFDQLIQLIESKVGELEYWLFLVIFSVLYSSVQVLVFHRLSLFLQRVACEITGLGRLLPRFIAIAENFLVVLLGIAIPLNVVAIAMDRGTSIVQVASIKPEGTDPEVWEVIITGIHNAQINGISCNPYLMLALKEYETGSMLCDTEGDTSCISSVGCLGMMQFDMETCERNASRHAIACDPWDPARSVEIACYAINDEMSFSLEQSKEEFVSEFSEIGFIWNADSSGASMVYDRAIALENEARNYTNVPTLDNAYAYEWPAPKEAFIAYEWGIPMAYGEDHNGIDIDMPEYASFIALAVDSGDAFYWYGGECNMGVITLFTDSGDIFQYVHMEVDPSKIFVSTTLTRVERGQELGWVLDSTTTCSTGPHLHLMMNGGEYLGQEIFEK